MSKEFWLIWKDPNTRRRYKIGILTIINDEYHFKYNEDEIGEAIDVGFDFFPGFVDIKQEYKSKELFANISTRLPNSTRPDYLEVLETYGLNRKSTQTEILEKTKGRLLTDEYEFVSAFNKEKIEFDVAGTRYCKDIDKCKKMLRVDERLQLELEPENEYDRNAIRVIYTAQKGEKYKIGYVPRYYSEQLTEILKNNVEYVATIQYLRFDTPLNDENISAKVELILKK